MKFYFYFMYCFIKIWAIVIIMSQSLFPIFEHMYVCMYVCTYVRTYVRMYICICGYIFPNNTHKGCIIKCKFLKEWYVEVNACLHACFQLQQTILEHKNTLNIVLWDKLTVTTQLRISYVATWYIIAVRCFTSPVCVVKLQNWILFICMKDHTAIKNYFILCCNCYVSWCSVSYLKQLKYYQLLNDRVSI
jgi:hypothetical protein